MILSITYDEPDTDTYKGFELSHSEGKEIFFTGDVATDRQ